VDEEDAACLTVKKGFKEGIVKNGIFINIAE
jgi:hypothetical protein